MTNNTIKIVLLKVWFFNPCPGVIGLKEQYNYLQLKDVGINFTGKKQCINSPELSFGLGSKRLCFTGITSVKTGKSKQ
jgi:hypothetical protein